MTTDRPYRRARSVEQALEELRAESGRQFNPRVVEVLERVLVEPAPELQPAPVSVALSPSGA